MKFEFDPLVADMLDQLPTEVWTSATTTFLDPAIGGGQFVRAIEQRLRAAGHSDANIRSRVFGYDESNLHIRFAVNKYKLVGQYSANSYTDFLDAPVTTKFDIVVSNPPYRSKEAGGQNKIYNQFAKKALDVVADNGKIAFITPSPVLKDSKRFSLIGKQGLKIVNFDANFHFPDVGVNVCSWIVDKEYTGDVTVVSQQHALTVPANAPIYNPAEFDADFIKIYEALKNNTKTPKDRMFKQNPVDASINGRSKTKTTKHQYPVYKIVNNGEELVQYNKPMPKLHGKKKFVISVSKAFTETSCIVSTSDFDVNHVFIDVKNQKEVNNIKSFLFSDYFISHTNNFKRLDGYGFNNSIKYLPPFDKSKTWTDDEVKAFIESFI